MGLTVGFGIGPEWMKDEDLEVINAGLTERGLPAHSEPTELNVTRRGDDDYFPYGELGAIQDAYYGLASNREESQLLCHEFSGMSCYLPLDFEPPIQGLSCDWGCVGSAPRLLRELLEVAEVLGARLDAKTGRLAETERERLASGGSPAGWFSLYEATELAIAHGTVVCIA